MIKGEEQHSRIMQSRRWWWVAVAVGVVCAGAWAYRHIDGAHSRTARRPIHRSTKVATELKATQNSAIAVDTDSVTALKHGSQLTAVMLMASWCLYCAYEDKYVWPTVLTTPGFQLDLVDVSARGGIGVPGPQSPPFSGHDQVGATEDVLGTSRTMQEYLHQFGLTQANVSAYVAPSGWTIWHMSTYPTIVFLNRKGMVVERVNGALTAKAMQNLVFTLDAIQAKQAGAHFAS